MALGWVGGALAVVHLGDSSVAAIIAAVASMFNAYMVIHAHGVQSEIRGDLKEVNNDTNLRARQIIELRSLSEERERQINKMERLADRFAALDIADLGHTVKRIEEHVTGDNGS